MADDNSLEIKDPIILALAWAGSAESLGEAIHGIRGLYDAVKELEDAVKVRQMEFILFRLLVLDVYNVYERLGRVVDRALYCGSSEESAAYRNNIIKGFDATFDRNNAGLYLKQAVEHLDRDDQEKAFEYFRKSALEGSALSAYHLGKMLMEGKGCEKDEFMGAFWHWQSVNMNNVNAMASLGYDYYDGRGVAKSLPRAMFWFATGAYHMDKVCIKELADMLIYEDVIGNEVEAGKALLVSVDNLDNEEIKEYVQGAAGAVNQSLAAWLIKNEGGI